MRRGVLHSLPILLACGGGDSEGDGSASGTVEATADASGGSNPTTTPGTDGSLSGSVSASAATEESAGTSDASITASSTADTTGETAGDGPGPIVLYIGPPGGAVIPDWDSTDPRPVMAGQRGAFDAWTGATLTIHPDGTVSSFAKLIIIWGFEPLAQIYDGVHFTGVLPSWNPDAPAPVIALGTGPTFGDDWLTMTPGLWVDTDGGFVAPGSTVERVVVWSFEGAAEPPNSIYEGPWDGSFVLPAWDPDLPSPLVAWADTAVAGQWLEAPVAVFDDGSTEAYPTGGLLVYGW